MALSGLREAVFSQDQQTFRTRIDRSELGGQVGIVSCLKSLQQEFDAAQIYLLHRRLDMVLLLFEV